MNASKAKVVAGWTLSFGIAALSAALVWSLYDQVLRYL